MTNPYNRPNSKTETRAQPNSNNGNSSSDRPKIVIVNEGAVQRSQNSFGVKKDK